MKPRIALLLLALGASLPTAQAQTGNWPEKPVRIIVSYPPGGATDIVGRLVGQKLSEALKQPFIIESRPGAAGNIGHDYVAKAPASREQGSRLRDANVREQGESAVGLIAGVASVSGVASP